MASNRFPASVRYLFVGLLPLAAAGALVWAYRNRRLVTVSDITAGENFDFPELRAHVYFARPEQALDAARRGIAATPGFRLAVNDPDDSRIVAEVRSGRSDGSYDEITIKALPLGPRHARVVIRSRSHRAGVDFGRNAKHIKALQAAMDELLVGG